MSSSSAMEEGEWSEAVSGGGLVGGGRSNAAVRREGGGGESYTQDFGGARK